MTLAVAVPIMIQNFITNFVSMLDNLMVGSLGTEQMSGVSIVNQLFFVFNLAIFGALSGAGIFTSQFYGKNDNNGIRYTLRYKLIVSVILLAVAFGIFLLLDDFLINLYLHESDGSGDISITLNYAKEYLKVMLLGLVPFCIAQIFSSTLRETGETVAPMVAGFIAVATNCALNWVLIFGKLGAPALGVVGAATATVVSRYVECIVIIIYVIKKKKRFPYFKGALRSFSMPKKVFRDITFKGMPLLFNEFFWSLGMSLLSMAYSLYGISVVAGYSISSTVMNLANIAFISLGSSIGIIIGKQLGANQFKEAVDTDRKLIAFSAFLSAVIGIFVFLVGDKIPLLYNTTEESKELAGYFIKVCSLFIPVHSFANATYFTIRSGGKTLVTFLMDSVFIMCVSVPIAFSLYYVFHLPIWYTFPIVQCIDIIKVVIGIILVKKKVWLNNIVSE
ncbi:MAG: MATE family efflux transporter [Acutalibacteraceae bacterium]|nr:MATE family efflux transporter [Acutalibacteraceae bacterium]